MIGGDVVEFRFSVKTTGRQRFIGTRSAVGPQQHRPEALNSLTGSVVRVGHRARWGARGRVRDPPFRRGLHKIATAGMNLGDLTLQSRRGLGKGVWQCI